MTETLRPELLELPADMRILPVRRGYPVPWFVQWLDDDNNPTPIGEGTPDFRVMRQEAVVKGWLEGRCWVCGKLIRSQYRAFLVGPMCAVNKVSAEPPSHKDCAVWSAKCCPFMSRPYAKRREHYEQETSEGAGIMLKRNPGVGLVWVTRRPGLIHDPNGGTLFDIGPLDHAEWYAEGRAATREEVLASINSGLPALEELTEGDPEGKRELARLVANTIANAKLLPAY